LISLIMLLAPLTAHGIRPIETGNPKIVSHKHAAVSKAVKEEASSMHVAATHAGAFVALKATEEHKKGKLEPVHVKSVASKKKQEAPEGGEDAEEKADDAAEKAADEKEGVVKEGAEKEGAEKEGAAGASEGVDIAPEWLDFLYELLDADGKDGIDKDEWAKLVKGQWADPMWAALDKSGDEKVDKEEWTTNWDPAVTAAFKKMITSKDTSEKEIDAWSPAEEYEKAFAKKELLGEDKVMDRSEFEEFIYTAMEFRAIDENGDGTISWEELEKNAKAKAKFGPEKADFAKFGKDGMQLDELLKYLNTKQAFGSKVVGGENGSERAALAYTALAAILLCAWQ